MTIRAQHPSHAALSAPETTIPNCNFPFFGDQLSREQARDLFFYDNGRLLWREGSRRRRPDAGSEYYRKSTRQDPIWVILLGARGEQRFYMRRYLVWNWHFGETDQILVPRDGDHLNDRIGNIGFAGRLAKPEIKSTVPERPLFESRYGVNCPCCDAPVQTMSADIATQVYGITEQQSRILRAVWSGKGKPVQMERVFTEMYHDDPEGGPTQVKMYAAFKVALSHLRSKLKGSGISIVTVGYRQGYRLILQDKV
ncbi:helix-turn-helix domain-containing protein [Rhizobium sp. RM]|uniref:helix-turn-helix domain-containing protein n=1 Tax=Rhizobium sp. RM TaxID=2748079 RepID=UPI00110E2E9F|nr:helix-turn-helix domain-containing protein [Rhizobium sp. RM]NWJ26181.1 helix-turn-helix domain-containing protein [Rhizobium sp. RM]TMV20772.1 helix-turn-helix domain-containing protein [Rhizobium sp. Td3]